MELQVSISEWNIKFNFVSATAGNTQSNGILRGKQFLYLFLEERLVIHMLKLYFILKFLQFRSQNFANIYNDKQRPSALNCHAANL